MNKNAIKKFAIEARKKLIASVSDKAGMLGITPEGCSEPITKGGDFEVYKTVAGTEVTLNKNQCRQRRKLVEQIEARGFEAVVEEVAYTWFNRICAIRFMEVNDYLPTRVRVLSSEKEGKNEPDIVTQAPDVDLDFTDKECEYILDCKMNNKLDELYKMLFIKQCNKLSEILPELFEATEDYTEMLLNISYTNKDDIIYMLVNQEAGIPEADFNVSSIGEDGQPTGQVEIIGWLYQYYNTELKDDTFAQLKKNVKISKERIPSATQLFTPDWIVRYMVENSVGRLWIEHLRAVDPTVNEKEVAERFGWKYYLPEAEQEADVNIKLTEIRTSYKDLKPEDITCIDACMGSGHILVAMFDVLMDIYKSAGYSERDAAFEIVEHNIHGLDIDKRAYQLAYFAVMMKGRGYNRRFFRGKEGELLRPCIYVIQESNGVNREQLKYFGASLSENLKKEAYQELCSLIDEMQNARELGSILNVKKYNWKLLHDFCGAYNDIEQISFDTYGIDELQRKLLSLLDVAYTLEKKYEVVVTNPPYLGISVCNQIVNSYVKNYYYETKTDMFAVFMKKCSTMCRINGIYSLITQHSWMFLKSFRKLREEVAQKDTLSLLHLGARAFDEIGGEVVQTSSFVIRNNRIPKYKGTYVRLVNGMSEKEKKCDYLEKRFRYCICSEKFEDIEDAPIAYWVPEKLFHIFNTAKQIGDYGDARVGMQTGANDKFIRLWEEIDYSKLKTNAVSSEDAVISGKKWFPYNKGGESRKWYGNNDWVVNWYNDGEDIKNDKLYKLSIGLCLPSNSKPKNMQYYFMPSITWSKVSSGGIAFRYKEPGHIFDIAGASIFTNADIIRYMHGFCNSVVATFIAFVLSPTINYEAGTVSKFPLVIEENYKDEIERLVTECIEISKKDYDSFETSWDFGTHPLIKNNSKIVELFEVWKRECENRFLLIEQKEKRLNELFLQIYGLTDELSAEISKDNITVRVANRTSDIKSLISYIVGCMFGRYSVKQSGIVCAGPDMHCEEVDYVDADNIIPITDEEYFTDDIVSRFVSFVSNVYGEENLEENLDFIADSLENKGNSSREKIRNYFINDFFKDHCSTYSVTGSGKRPIYWLFDSGKENGFKCLMYMHRYTSETVGKIRIDYLHKTQKAIEQAMHSAEYVRDNATSGTEKSSATKRITKFTKQLAEIKQYDEAMAHIANQRIELDLDDGVKVNYAKFQGVEVAQEGKKTLKIDLLAKI